MSQITNPEIKKSVEKYEVASEKLAEYLEEKYPGDFELHVLVTNTVVALNEYATISQKELLKIINKKTNNK